jgi:hypothetical protein
LLRQSHQFFVAQFLLFGHLSFALKNLPCLTNGLDAETPERLTTARLAH